MGAVEGLTSGEKGSGVVGVVGCVVVGGRDVGGVVVGGGDVGGVVMGGGKIGGVMVVG